jgi:nickel transport protein
MFKKTLCLLLLLLGLAAGQALAHKVNIFAYVEGDTVYTESYFPDGKKIANGTITVLDATGDVLLHGKTDAQGLFSFPLRTKESLTIVIDASMGHKNRFFLEKSEM